MIRPVILFTLVVLSAGCNNSSVRSTPPLQSPASATPQPAPKPGVLEQMSDATVRIVQEPARMLTPKKPPAPQEPKTYDPPAAMIIRRPWVDPETATAPAPQP